MKHSTKHFFSLILISLLLIVSAAAQNWYVCLGSFKTQYYADSMMGALYEAGYDVCSTEEDTALGHMYRVFLYEPCATAKEAKAVRNRIMFELPIVEHTEGNLWVCQTVPITILKHEKVEKVVLETNNEIPLSEEKPYSVKVHSYKEELQAEKGKQKLKEKNIDSYILKTFDENTSFTFNLHSGAFKTIEETYDLIDKLYDLGICDTEFSDYTEILEKMKKYDEVVKTQVVTYESGKEQFSDLLSKYLVSAIKDFPANNNYQIERLCVYNIDENKDLDFSYNEYDSFDDFSDFSNFNDIIDDVEKTHVGIYASYYDELFDKNVEIYLLEGEPNSLSDYFLDEDFATIDFPFGTVRCDAEDLEDNRFEGISLDNSKYIKIYIDDYDTEMKNLIPEFSESNVLSFNQIKKNLCILPNQNAEKNRKFRCFTFSQVKQNYADLRSNANWATNLVGHYLSAMYISEASNDVSIAIFDLDYDFNANTNQSYYIESHESSIGSNNYPVDYRTGNGWFSKYEFTCSQKSYQLAVDCYTIKDIEAFKKISDDLQIWD